MQVELLSVFTICACVYILARFINWAEAEKAKESSRRLEQERLEKIDSLYGRRKD